MKPVTELWNAAFEVWDESEEQERRGLARLGRAVVALQDAKHGGCLDVLDLVATLPPERLGLVRWVVGLSDAARMTMLGALSLYAHKYSLGEEQVRASRLYEALRLQSAALTVGEGEAKCPECHGAGKVKRLEGGGSVRVVKYDPCPKCAEGDGGAKEEAKPTILPAGKPPPFLRVGMVLRDPVSCRDVWIDALSEGVAYGHTASGQCSEWASRVVRWPLAEPFTVEGES